MKMKNGLQYLPASQGFLEADRPDAAQPDQARCVVIPFPLEVSVSYGTGTSAGPQAILDASHQLELFDEELWCAPCSEFGVATMAMPPLPGEVDRALSQLSGGIEDVLAENRFPLVLGGEHALTPAAVAPFARRYKDLVVLQLDAHADLRDSYQGNRNSHACAMRRVLDHDHLALVSVGVRAISAGEIPYLEANSHRITMNFARDMDHWDLTQLLAPLAGRPVYITFDIDALDGGIMPATGTPEPGGLSFWQACAILRHASTVGRIVGADLVELAPREGLHACDFTAAKLAYKIMSYALSART